MLETCGAGGLGSWRLGGLENCNAGGLEGRKAVDLKCWRAEVLESGGIETWRSAALEGGLKNWKTGKLWS